MAEAANQTSTTNYKRLAEQAQLARRNKRLSIRKVAQLTNLPEDTIRALEHPSKSNLPDSNVRGLYRVYGEAVGLSDKQINDLLGPDKTLRPELVIKPLKSLKKMIIVSNYGNRVVVGLILVAVLSYVAWQGFGLVSRPQLEVDSPSDQITLVDAATLTVSGTADEDDTVLINGQPVALDIDSGEFSQDVFLQEGYNTVRVEAVNSFSRTAAQNFTVIFQPSLETD